MKCCPLNEIFSIQHGNKFDKNKMRVVSHLIEDSVAFVGRSAVDNGITDFVMWFEGVEPYPPGLITVALGGSALSSFVQPFPFYTGQNIDVLIPPDDMAIDERLYYCRCIEANQFRYSTFGREANRTLAMIPVPSRKSVPDWVKGASERAMDILAYDLKRGISNLKINASMEDAISTSFKKGKPPKR